MMIDLLLASTNLRKAARMEGFRAGQHKAYYKPVTGDEVKAIVGDEKGKEVKITIFDIEYAAQFTWREIRTWYTYPAK